MPDGRLYLYGSLDVDEDRYCSDRYRVASTGDLRRWTVHDVAFRSEQVTWATDSAPAGASFLDGAHGYEDLPAYVLEMLPEGTIALPFEEFATAVRSATRLRQPTSPKLYAPDAIERDGRYFLYFCLSDDSEGVAVSDRPDGPFGDAVRLPAQGIDPAVFVDDDGEAYFYWGQFAASGVRLHRSMTSFEAEHAVHDLLTEAEHHFHEGSSMRKRGDTYYLVFADTSRGRPTCLGYATASTPLGPFRYRGVIIDNAPCDPQAWNNHGSIEEYLGQWYVFYHRNSRNVNSMRRVCAEPIYFAADGTIAEVPMTSQGPGSSFALDEVIPAYTACGVSGGAFIGQHETSEAVVGIGDGASVTFRYLDADEACASMRVTADGEGSVAVVVDNTVVGSASLAAGCTAVRVEPGRHTVELVFSGCKTACSLLDLTFERPG